MKKQEEPVKIPTDQSTNLTSQELKALTELILQRIKAEKIICFGSIIGKIEAQSCFIEKTSDKQSLNTYSLLLIPSANEHIPEFALQQTLEQELKKIANVTIIVHKMEEINRALENGSSFFTSIYKKGILLHDNENEPFTAPATCEDLDKHTTKRKQFWHKWFLLSENFLKGAIFYAQEQNNNLSVFMLHQTLQHCYSGMLRILTGYRCNSNSLKRLLNLIDNALPNYSLSLSGNTPENSRLNGLLLKGFGDARYNEKFNITDQELLNLITRIENILIEANIKCSDHIKNIK